MITPDDLEAAIAECQGQRNPNANTCLKLAAYYTIRREMQEAEPSGYSYAAPPVEQAETLIDYDSGTEFSQIINGRSGEEVWPIIDEAMTALRVVNPRLYAGVLRKLNT